MDGINKYRVYFERNEVWDGKLVRKPANMIVLADSEADARNLVESRYASVDAFVKSVIAL